MSFWFINALFASDEEREEAEKARERRRALKARKRRELRLKHLRDLDRERDPSPTGSSQDANKKKEMNATSLVEAALDRGFASGYSAGSYQPPLNQVAPLPFGAQCPGIISSSADSRAEESEPQIKKVPRPF